MCWSAGATAQTLSVAEVLSLPSTPPDHRVSYGSDSLQFANLRLPNGPGPHGVIVFIHGGCWLSQYDISHVGPLEQAMADSGYAVWSLEYRRVGDLGGGWPGTFQDIARGADHLRAVAEQYRLDLSRVVASGHSAGGQLALWLAGRGSIPANSELYVERPLAVHGVLALAPAPDLEGLHEAGVCGNVIEGLMGGSPTEHPARYESASPMRIVPIPVPQVLVVGSLDDAWGPVGRAYYERALAAGDTGIRLLDARESGHFEMIVPSTSSWPIVVDALGLLVEEFARVRDRQ